jgi:hypothetical protein
MPKRFLKMGASDESCDSEPICARSSFNCSEVGRTRRDRCTAAQRGVEVMGQVMEEEATGSESSCACALPELTGSVMAHGPRIQRSCDCTHMSSRIRCMYIHMKTAYNDIYFALGSTYSVRF